MKQETDILDTLMHAYCMILVSCSNGFLNFPHHLRSQPSHGHPPGLCRICRLQSGPLRLCTPQTAHEYRHLLQPSPTIKITTVLISKFSNPNSEGPGHACRAPAEIFAGSSSAKQETKKSTTRGKRGTQNHMFCCASTTLEAHVTSFPFFSLQAHGWAQLGRVNCMLCSGKCDAKQQVLPSQSQNACIHLGCSKRHVRKLSLVPVLGMGNLVAERESR